MSQVKRRSIPLDIIRRFTSRYLINDYVLHKRLVVPKCVKQVTTAFLLKLKKGRCNAFVPNSSVVDL